MAQCKSNKKIMLLQALSNGITDMGNNFYPDTEEEALLYEIVKKGGISGGGSSTPIELPRIFFEGDITGMSKDVSKDVTFTYMDKSTEFKGVANLKWQGTSSVNFPKKNFTMKMYKDSSKAKKLKHDFGWGNESKYVLKANYIDHTHARNIVSARIWSKIVASRPDYESLPTLMKESPNNCAVDGFPIKLYMNGKYEGLYTLNIPKDAWMFNMDDTLDEHCVLCGENYVSGNFRGTPLLNGSDWSDEIHDKCPAIIKSRWKAVVDFVMNSTDEEFKANLDQYFDVISLIDYYIFHYFNCGLDAFGKNQLYATYDGNLWYACSYDMDSTWGLYYNGTKFVSEEYRCQEDYESSINNREGNLLYIRLADMFPTEIYTRYKQLRKDVLALPNIAMMFEDFCYKIPSNLYDEDVQIYTGIPNNKTSNVTQIRNYAAARAIYVDAQMELLAQTNAYTITNNLTNVSNSNSATSINDGEAYSATLTADTNYTLGDVTVTMGEEDITSTVYSNGTITIESVTGNIVITATATASSSGGGTGDPTAIISRAAYSLPSEVIFNGTNAVDTGVRLFDEDKDWSVYLEFEGSPSPMDGATEPYRILLHSMEETAPYKGFYFGLRNNLEKYALNEANANKELYIDKKRTDTQKIIIYHKAGENKIYARYPSDDTTISDHNRTDSLTSSYINITNSSTVVLGGYKNISGEFGRYWKGTLDKCYIWNEVLSDDEMTAMVGTIE